MPTRDPQPRPVTDVHQELQLTRPFRSESQEATLALMRTASMVTRHLGRVVEPHGLSLSQYNVLRILRGAGGDGLPTLAIRDRLIEEGATITRLVDRLEAAGLVQRDRTQRDRRQVRCRITEAGLRLLATLDPQIDAADQGAMAALPPAERRRLIELLAQVRAGVTAPPCSDRR
ncbi:MAG: MarR family winged helix-turn-helix transcriptional regulator [Gemmatimonadaceae bacterium]